MTVRSHVFAVIAKMLALVIAISVFSAPTYA